MLNNEKDLVTRLLKQNIVTLCKETVSYDTQLEIDGIICISTGNESQQIVVKVHNFFQKLGNKPQQPRKTTLNDIFKQSVESNEWENRNQQKRYPINGQNLPIFQDPSIQTRNNHLKFNQESKSFVRNVQYENEPILSNGDLIFNGQGTGNQEHIRRDEEPTIPKTISGLEKDESVLVENDKLDSNDSFSGSDTMDYEDIANETSPNSKDNLSSPLENNSMALELPYESPSKLLPNLNDPKPARKHSTADENSMIECKLGKNCNTDEDLSKVPIRLVKDIPCKRCGVILDDGASFEQHNTDVHSVYTCRVCFNTFTCRNNMKRHMRLHTGFRPYRCKLCSESFTRKDDIKRHLIRHSFDKPFRCNICRKGYMDRKTVKNHIRKEHNSKTVHICQTCGEAFDNSVKFQDHKKNHPELKMFQCSLCKFTGSNLLAYNKHQLVHETKKDYRCDPCDLVFGDPLRYSTHLRKHRSDPNFSSYRCCFCEVVLPSYELFMRHEHTHDQPMQLTCYVCMKQFQSEATLAEHKRTHQNYNCENETSQTTNVLPNVVPPHVMIHQPIFPSFMSAISPNISMSEDPSDINHIKSEVKTEEQESRNNFQENRIELKHERSDFDTTGSQPNDYWCAECQHGFATEHHLTEHIALAHENNSMDEDGPGRIIQEREVLPPLRTENKSSEKVNVLTKSELFEMSDDESYEELEAVNGSFEESNCSSSSIRYTPVPIFSTSKSHKRIASRLHDKIKGNETLENDEYNDVDDSKLSPEVTCSPTLDTQEYSNQSDENYGNIKGKRNYHTQNNFTCDICFKNFIDFETFDQHSSSVHRKFVCHFCGKAFTSRPNRDRHVRYHTGEKPFRCDVCHQCFVRGDDLRYHRTSKHPDVKPYTCNICGMSFPWARDLERHAKTHGMS